MAIIKSSTTADQLIVDPITNAARITIYGTGTAQGVGVETVAGRNYLETITLQDIEESPGNTSIANIVAGATFPGVSESNLGVASIQIMFFCDRDCTITLEQSINNSNWDFVDSYKTQANVASAETRQGKGSYFRVRVTNNGLSDTTVVRLQTVLVPIAQTMNNYGSVMVEPNARATYRAHSAFPFTPVANIIGTLKGSATKTVKVTKVGATYSSAGSTNLLDLLVYKLSGIVPGARATLNTVSFDSLYTPSSTGEQYTAISTGYPFGPSPIEVKRINQLSPASTGAFVSYSNDFVFGNQFGGTPIVLRGTGQMVALLLSGTLAGTPLAYTWFEWTEE